MDQQEHNYTINVEPYQLIYGDGGKILNSNRSSKTNC